MASRRPSRDQYFISPNKSKMPDVLVVPDFSFPAVLNAPKSPTLSIPSGAYLSPGSSDSLNRRSNSTVSSIFDLSFESEQLERAIRDNDVNAITKILQIHHGKFPMVFNRSHSGGSERSDSQPRSRRPSSRTTSEVEFVNIIRKPQPTYFDRYDIDRRESVTPECDIPDIFKTSLHSGTIHNSADVIKVLLKYGIDPNEPRANVIGGDRRGSSVFESSHYGIFQESGKLRPECVLEETSELANNENALTADDTICCPDSQPNTSYLSVNIPNDNQLDKHRPSVISSIQEHPLNYSQEELFKLPPLYLAVTEKRPTIVNLLLQFGADANAHDRFGNSPLHVAVKPEYYNVESCNALLRYGCRIHDKNRNGQTPYEIQPELVELQKGVIRDLLSGKSFSLEKCMDRLKVGSSRNSYSSNSDSCSRSWGRSGSIKKFFKRSTEKDKEKEKVAKERRRNESTSTEYNQELKDYASSVSSYRSSRSVSRLYSTAITEDLDNEALTGIIVPIPETFNNDAKSTTKSLTSRMSLRRGKDSKHRNSYASEQYDKSSDSEISLGGHSNPHRIKDRSSLEETERSLRALIKLATNTECVSSVVDGLGNYMKLVLALTEHADSPIVERAINELFNQIIQTCYEQLKSAKTSDEKLDLFLDLSKLLNIAFELLKGKQSLHFTALTTINRIIDMCVVHRNYEISSLTKSSEQVNVSTSDVYRHSSPKRKTSHCVHAQAEDSSSLHRHVSLSKKERRQSHDNHSKEFHERHSDDHEDSKSSSIPNSNVQVCRTPLEILTSSDPSQILSILHNNITMHKRIIGTRQKCTPSTRWRQCTHHCLQILSARILTVMSHGAKVQHRIVNEGHAKTLVEALDPNHDPHLLCLLLQSLSSIALNPSYHSVLSEADIADMLMQLLLPSDEWYYTNHSTKYAKFVKYHAARILVYMGQLHRLGGRVDLFDKKLFEETTAANPILQVHSPEDNFIELMALGKIVMWNENRHIQSASLEGLISEIIQEAVLEERECNSAMGIYMSASMQSLCELRDRKHGGLYAKREMLSPIVSPTCSIRTLAELNQRSFREFLFMALPMIVHPVIILRLLAHKMFGNMIRRKNFPTQDSKLKAQDSKLKPPKEENIKLEEMCPPRSNSESAKSKLESISNKKKKNLELALSLDSSGSKASTSSSTKGLAAVNVKNSNNQGKNGTKMALKAIGESLVTPLEMNIDSHPKVEGHPVVTSPLSSTDSRGSKPKLFHWASKKHLSKSQINISYEHRDSIVSRISSQNGSPGSMHDVDILAFQRELICLPTFVMDTPLDISPVFSRSSSVPENLTCRLNPNTGSLCQLSAHSSHKRLSKASCGSEQALTHSGSFVTITMTDVDHRHSLFFFPPDESTTDTPEESMANIIVHFDPPGSPLLSSASGSPQGFDFPTPPKGNQLLPGNNSLQTPSSQFQLPQPGVLPDLADYAKPTLQMPEIHRTSPMTVSPSSEIPSQHRGVLKVIETWVSVASADLEDCQLVMHEMREFLKKLAALGHEYKVWSQRIYGALHLEESLVSNQSAEGPDDSINVQYRQLQELIVGGELPCSKEEAATLAGIQLHLEEAWPEDNLAGLQNGPSTRFTLLKRKMTDGHGKMHKTSDAEKQENLRKKKELIRSNRAGRITISRRKGRLVRQLSCMSDHEIDTISDVDLSKYLPPHYTASKKVRQLIQEKQNKLWHTPYYDSQMKLKQLYIKICKNLPAYNCKLFQVKEMIRGNTQKKVTRLLGITSEKVILLDNKSKLLNKTQNISDLCEWRTGSGKSQDGLVLEFRGTKKWNLSMSSLENLKSVTAVLWDALDKDGRFDSSSRRDSFEFDFQRKQLMLSPDVESSSKYSKEFENLQRMLHFPEEVAFLLTKVESELFCQAPPADYIRQITQDLTRGNAVYSKISKVDDLIQRFNEVSTWITQLIITQPTNETRKAVLSCIFRLAQYCWCIGNFNAAMEILTGLNSDKLKNFWERLTPEEVAPLHSLSNALLSREPTAEYRDAVNAAIDIPECKIVPYFGFFLRDLRNVFKYTPSVVVLPSEENQSLEFISDYNGEDRFMTRIGVGGLINIDKLKQAHVILNDIELFHCHSRHQNVIMLDRYSQEAFSRFFDYHEAVWDSGESDYDLDFDSYQPIRTLTSQQEVMIITPRRANLNHHWLQCMHHGSTLVHWDEDSARSAMCFIRLEADNCTLTWKKPNWIAPRGNSATISDYVFHGDYEFSSVQALYTRYYSGEQVFEMLEEGYVDVTIIKDVCYGDVDEMDLNAVCKRHGLENVNVYQNCICLKYGVSKSENKRLYFVAPSRLAGIWYQGLTQLVMASRKLRNQTDKRIQWLKFQYLQQYYEEERCQGPTTAEAIKVFGGRRWTPGPQVTSGLHEPNTSFRRTPSFVVGSTIFKKKGSGGFTSKESSPKPTQMSGSGSGKGSSSQKGRRSPSPQSKHKHGMIHSISSAASDPQLTSLPSFQSQSTNAVSRPRSHTVSFLNRYRSRRRRTSLGAHCRDNKTGSITHSTRLSFLDYVDLFRSFGLRCRKDLRDLFEQFANYKPSLDKQATGQFRVLSSFKDGSSLTRNNAFDLSHSTDIEYLQRRKICDALAAASIFENCAGVDTSQNHGLGLKEFREFLEDYQEEHLDDNEIIQLIQRHEPDHALRDQCCLSFEGFAKYLMDKDNYAWIYEKTKHNDEDMDHPLAHYYIASSHNTYLTGHQLKGESSVELYSQVLMMGCRCVELDCWDGDDGMPIIYHGHTLTTKISFKAVVEAINRSAFVTSPYPVMLSLENHCSVPQQQKMAHIFTTVFGDKLVTDFLFDTDFVEDPQLPSPNQLRYKILIKNKKIRADQNTHPLRKSTPYSRSSFTMSFTESSVTDFDDEDDDDEDEVYMPDVKESRRSMDSADSQTDQDDKSKENMTSSGSCGDLSRRLSSSFAEKNRPKSQPDLDWQFDEDDDQKRQPKEKAKNASQIAKDLSDLVVYLQAVKFRGLNISPNSSLKQKVSKPGPTRKILTSGGPGTPPLLTDKSELSVPTNILLRQKRPDNTPSCYLVSSLNENKNKQLCRRSPTAVINHTEKQLMRTYPAGMRIDSSNFNPVIFWAFGIQMVALNYQTEDTAMALNAAMFEQNCTSGYVLKPAVMWDKSHVMYNHFNPWDKEFDGLHATVLTLHVISGQYVCGNYTASTQVEVEIMGIPVDCAKHKTKVISRNSLNPIWNDVFTFQVMFSDLAFIRFVVIDTSTSHIVSQRVIPLKCLRPGYRHVRLRSQNNQPLDLATLFIYSKHEEELLEPYNQHELSHDTTSAILKSVFAKVKDLSELGKDGRELMGPIGTKLKRRMFFISVFGVTAPDEYVILKVTQDTSVYDAIAQALVKAGKVEEKVADHVLVEDVQNSWDKKDQERSSTQRILSMSEKVLLAQNKWKGAGKFVLRKVSTDPSSRAWVTTMLSKEQRQKLDPDSCVGEWDHDEHMFLVCVYNVSPDQPYTIFKAPTSSTAQDIITQAMMKAHRSEEEDPRNFILLEELDAWTEGHPGGGKKRDGEKVYRRILAADENVYQAQNEWKTNGRFVLIDRDMVDFDPDMFDKKKKNVRLKGSIGQPQTSSSGSTLARKFCSRISKSLSTADTVSTGEDSQDTTPLVNRGMSCPSPHQIPLLETSAPPPSPTSSSQPSSSKWKKLWRKGKT